MQIKPRADMTREELLEEVERLLVDAEISRQEIISANAEKESLRQQLSERDKQMESIGAGGVSRCRITDDGTLEALQACERTYHQMMLSSTPDNCYAHDKAREQFWRVFGGQS